MIRYEINQNILSQGARLRDSWLKKNLKAIEKYVKIGNAYKISIAFIDNKSMRKLNRLYRGKDKVTDVLSFEGVGGSDAMGEIILSWPRISDQAEKNKVSFKEEVAKLIVHGVLHLRGFDHENVSAAKAKKMFDLQEKIFRNLYSV